MASVSDQRLALAMKRIHDEQKVTQREGESLDAYYARLRQKALQIMRYERAKKRKSARAARKRNRT